MSGTHKPMERFDANAREALDDRPLRKALRKATVQFGERRRNATADLGAEAWQALRARGRAIKDATLAHLDRHLEDFAKRAAELGVVIHWARDGAEACATIARIARDCAAKTIVKAKSMTSEEVRLNDHLEHEGFEPVETDLGEWIVQLAREVPSHIIVPAIHRSKDSIAELFHREVGTEPGADVQALTAAARKVLRDRFLDAELGVSGVNFAVAETGSILILENEGNIRLTTTLPRVHVALMGIEKVIPRLADLAVFLRLLPRAGTGQRLTSYQSLLTGPGARDGGDGPQQLHVVILDNGRSKMLASALTRQTLACIRCGACLNVCPIYQNVGGHAYGSVYPGPIGAVVTPQLVGVERARQLPFASTLCGACRDACPVAIDIPSLLLHLRHEVVEAPQEEMRRKRRLERIAFGAWSFMVRSRRRFEFASFLARLGQRLFVRDGRIGTGPFALRAWTRGRDLRPLAKESFRARWANGLSSEAPDRRVP
ncbi:MAG: LutB/LldF family L-lactate oxidation iron-sulfur protein [Planctomycetota bacterium]